MFLYFYTLFCVMCNGKREYCAKSYDEISFLTTHNGFSNQPSRNLFPILYSNINNQNVPIERQFLDGVRATKAPVHMMKNVTYVCHGISKGKKVAVWDKVCKKKQNIAKNICTTFLNSVRPCFLDPATTTLRNALLRLVRLLDFYPREIFTLFLEDYVPLRQLYVPFLESGVAKYMYKHSPHRKWPSLNTLISSNRRLVVFSTQETDEDGDSIDKYPFNLEKQYLWSTSFDYRNILNLLDTTNSLYINRTEIKGKMWILQHFVTPLIAGKPYHASIANSFQNLKMRHDYYKLKVRTNANFIWVDFYQFPSHHAKYFIDKLNK
eukprot:NODE_333_length_9325_cov_0.557230.p5 type:complete len:322 gc:universal NODE_333_length_9325_cov_0.557230:3305-2340(-)